MPIEQEQIDRLKAEIDRLKGELERAGEVTHRTEFERDTLRRQLAGFVQLTESATARLEQLNFEFTELLKKEN